MTFNILEQLRSHVIQSDGLYILQCHTSHDLGCSGSFLVSSVQVLFPRELADNLRLDAWMTNKLLTLHALHHALEAEAGSHSKMYTHGFMQRDVTSCNARHQKSS